MALLGGVAVLSDLALQLYFCNLWNCQLVMDRDSMKWTCVSLAILGAHLLLAGCSNPGDISDDDYEEYKRLAGPKILYSCTSAEEAREYCERIFRDSTITSFSDYSKELQKNVIDSCVEEQDGESKVDVGYSAAKGMAVTYNMLLEKAETGCSGEFKILESEKH